MRIVLKKRKDFGLGVCKQCGIKISVDTAYQWNQRVLEDGSPALSKTSCWRCVVDRNKASRLKLQSKKRGITK